MGNDPEEGDDDREPEGFDFGDIRNDLKFWDREGVAAWLHKESAFWKWTDTPGIANLNSDVRERTYLILTQTASFIDPTTHPESPEVEIRQRVEDLFVGRGIPLSDSDAGKLFGEWAQRDPVGCAHGLEGWFGSNVVLRPHQGQMTVPVGRVGNWVRGAIIRQGLPDVSIPSNLTVVDLRREFSVEMREQRRLLAENLADTERVRGEVIAEKADFSRFRTQTVEKTDGMFDSFQVRMADQEAFYKNELSMRSAVLYWTDREADHEQLSANWGLAAAVLLGFGIVLLGAYCYATSTATSLELAGAQPEPATLTHAAVSVARDWLGSLTRLGLAVACVVWPLRIFVRNYLSHAHLAVDAAERAIVVRTYLALLNDDALKGDSELKVKMLGPVIESMFRHASDGIVKDDGMPWQPTLVADLLKSANRTG